MKTEELKKELLTREEFQDLADKHFTDTSEEYHIDTDEFLTELNNIYEARLTALLEQKEKELGEGRNNFIMWIKRRIEALELTRTKMSLACDLAQNGGRTSAFKTILNVFESRENVVFIHADKYEMLLNFFLWFRKNGEFHLDTNIEEMILAYMELPTPPAKQD